MAHEKEEPYSKSSRYCHCGRGDSALCDCRQAAHLALAPQHGTRAARRTLRIFPSYVVAPRKWPAGADLPTLTRIALVFGVGLDYFFTDPRKRHVVAISRRNERKVFPSDPKSSSIPWSFESLDFRANERKLNGFLAHFHSLPEQKITPHYHPGVELLYLIEGELEITIGVEKFQLSAGDSIYFDSLQKHAYRSLVKKPCTAVVITTTSST